MSDRPDRGLFVGRFQPFHRGHLKAIEVIHARRPTERLLIGIGSAQESFTIQNPFTAGERFDMIDRALRAAGIDGAQIVPLPDIHQHALWVRYVEGMLPKFHHVYTNNPLTQSLFEGAGYPVEPTEMFERERWMGVYIRAALARGEAMEALVPPAVKAYLEEIGAPARLTLLARPTETRREPSP